MHEFPIFTLPQANAVIAEVIELTDRAVAKLQEIEKVWGALSFKKFDAIHGVAEEDLIRGEWAHRVAALGVMPKGFFVVDFQSADPDTVYCWGYGEECVTHEHKTWEGFPLRRKIENARQ